MAITLGTDTYITEADADTYHSERGNTGWTGATTADKEIALRKATDYLDRNFRFRGYRKTASQRLQWPRYEAYDDDGFAVGGTLSDLPTALVEACATLAELYRTGTYNFERTVTASDTSIKKQKVDVIEIEYETSTRLQGSDVPSHIFAMLRGITISNSRLLRA